jgi:hypothetical protein
MVVYILAIRGWNKRSDDEINVGKEEKYGDWESGFKGWSPLLRITMDGEGMEVEVDEGAGYKNVDYG